MGGWTQHSLDEAVPRSFTSGRNYAHFCAREELWGIVLWGRPTEEDAAELGRSLVHELVAPAVPHTSIVDARRLEFADPGAFMRLHDYVKNRFDELSRSVKALAIVRPSGVAGALVSGLFEVVERPYPVHIVADLREGLRWAAEHAPSWANEVDVVATELDALFEQAYRTTPLLSGLRELLEKRLKDVALADAAVALGVNERTLQRRMRDAETSFQVELNEARVRAARTLLLDSDLPLKEIAREVGCGSLAHFSNLFRRSVGQAPGAWRTHHRSAPRTQ